jgi:hypothetical protein
MGLLAPTTWIDGFPELGIFVAAIVGVHAAVVVYWLIKCMSESAAKPKARFHVKGGE